MSSISRRGFLALGAGGLAGLGASSAWAQDAATDFVVHEWGVLSTHEDAAYSQSRSGGAPDWTGDDLPEFVYRWEALERRAIADWALPGQIGFSKKPVLYFYARKPLRCSVRVCIPTGRPHAWCPRAADWGPRARIPLQPPPGEPSVEELEAMLDAAPVRGGFLRWPDLNLQPDAPTDCLWPAKGWWSRARETDATPVDGSSDGRREKFLFYDALLACELPIRAAWHDDGSVALRNVGGEPLRHVFAVRVSGGTCAVAHIPELAARGTKKVVPERATGAHRALADGLVGVGLYRKEADAVADIWRPEFFEQEGTRVLAVLPRSEYDRLHPIEIAPAPRELTRVLIAHVECVDACACARAEQWLDALDAQDIAERDAASEGLKRLRRTAEPILRRALRNVRDSDARVRLQSLLEDASRLPKVTPENFEPSPINRRMD